MIKPEWLEGAYVVENTGLSYDEKDDDLTPEATNIELTRYRTYVHQGISNTTHIQPIMEALDYQPSQLEFRRDAILVEGKYDYYVLRYFAYLLGEDDLYLIPGTGASNLDPVVRIYIGWGWSFLVLHDDDTEGRAQHDRMRHEFDMVPERHFALLSEFVGSTKVKAFESLLVASDRLLIQQSAGRSSTKYQKKLFNQAVQELLARKQVVPVSQETKDRFTEVFRGLRERLSDLV